MVGCIQSTTIIMYTENIASFGSNPSKVTTWGQSAGSFSVDHHLKAYANDALVPFPAAIMSSGQMSFGHLAHASSAIDAWTGLSSSVGCGNVTDEIRLEEEGRGLVNDKVNMTVFFNAYLPPPLISSEDLETIVSLYRSDTRVKNDFDLASAIYTDLLWSCPQSILASIAASSNISTWRYHFNTSILNLLPKEYEWLGKFYGSEIILLFTDPDTTPYTPQAYAVYE
ncbi:hypothetical protein CaCOL14_004791 [Colletotrichum acutatum]